MESEFLDKTLELFEKKLETHTIKEISLLSGLSEGWLKTLKKDKKTFPTVHRIEKLYKTLSGKKSLKFV